LHTGCNAHFLDLHPCGPQEVTVGGIKITTQPWLKRSTVLNLSETLLIGYGMPKSDGFWSSSLCWPTSCMDPNAGASNAFEWIDPNRHKGTGVAVFTDGHS
jgi:hypothetical protein